ncbi:MAG: hypothetical protein ACREXW_18750 [Gammaproteobacteria bacterium]
MVTYNFAFDGDPVKQQEPIPIFISSSEALYSLEQLPSASEASETITDVSGRQLIKTA